MATILIECVEANFATAKYYLNLPLQASYINLAGRIREIRELADKLVEYNY